MAPPTPVTTATRPRWQPILGAALLIAGLIAGVIAVIALSDPSGQRSATGAPRTVAATDSASAPSTSSAASTGTTAPPRAPVIVLNNTQIPGLAATAGADLTAAGWTVTSTSNYSNNIESTAAYYDPSDPANEAAATELQREFPFIVRVVPRFSDLPPSPIVLVLTKAY